MKFETSMGRRSPNRVTRTSNQGSRGRSCESASESRILFQSNFDFPVGEGTLYLVALSERYAPNTTKRILAALRGVLKECWRLGRMTHDEYARAADIAPVRGQAPPRGRALKGTELEALFKGC